MDAEHISKYEAAAMYAYENTTAQTEVTKERNYLILDLEQCSAGFCTCDQKETKLIHNWDTTQTDLWDLCIENLQKLAGGTEREQIVSELESQRSRADNIMRNYFLSDRTVNKTLYQFPESKIILVLTADNAFFYGLTADGEIKVAGSCAAFLDRGRSQVSQWSEQSQILALAGSPSGSIAALTETGDLLVAGSFKGNIDKIQECWKEHIKPVILEAS